MRLFVWAIVAGVCLGAAASLPPSHWARVWLIAPAAAPLLLAAGWLLSAALLLWVAVLRQGWPGSR